MRHLWSLLAGLVAAPAIWVLVAAGQSESSETVARWVKNDTYNWANLISPSVYLAAGAVVLGLIAVLRISPLGPIAAGLALVGPYAGMFLAPFKVRDAVPNSVSLFGNKVSLDVPLDNGTVFLIGAMLLIATFSVQRWRSWPLQDGGPSDDTGLIDWQSGASDSQPSLGYPNPDAPLQTTSAGPSAWPPPARTGSGWGDPTR